MPCITAKWRNQIFRFIFYITYATNVFIIIGTESIWIKFNPCESTNYLRNDLLGEFRSTTWVSPVKTNNDRYCTKKKTIHEHLEIAYNN